jgi:hypothetical protein
MVGGKLEFAMHWSGGGVWLKATLQTNRKSNALMWRQIIISA